MAGVGKIQLGKNGVTDNFILTLRSNFQKYKNVKITVLRSARDNKEDVKNYMKEILEKLGDNYSGRTIGFTIAIKKIKADKIISQIKKKLKK